VKRRNFVLAATAWPALAWVVAVFGQSRKPPVLIGWLSLGSRETDGYSLAAVKEGLAALGWRDGSQVVIEERWADARPDRLSTLAGELVAKRPAVIVATPLIAATAATKAALKTPIVYIGGDPVAPGVVASLARPGGMVTGVTTLSSAISEKYLELLLAAAPKLRRIGFLLDTTIANLALSVGGARRAVVQHSVDARYAEVARPEEIEPALSRLAKEGAQGLVVMQSSMFIAERRRIVKLALTHRWPVVAGARELAEDGALLSYGADRTVLYRRAASYIDKILKGAKPGDLPIEQPTKFELVVNLKTAKAIGLTISQDLLFRADKVIE
jgi:putative ABC transport system substrate-binding protein